MGSNRLRDIIFYKIKEHMEECDFYVLNADLIGRPLIDIKKEYPERFLQVGIAEQNMISIACGLALEGKRPVTFSPNPFVYLRAYDQIRNGACAMHLPVAIIANGMGFVNPGLGVTHITTEDYQLFSLCPGMRIITVSDEAVAEAVAELLVRGIENPTYIRIDFDCDGFLPPLDGVDFDKGFRYIKHGEEDVLIIAQGYATRTAIRAAEGSSAAILDLYSKPFHVKGLCQEMQRYQRIVVVEEQQRRGGFGGELLEICNQRGLTMNIDLLAVDYGEAFPESFGSRKYWMDRYGVGEMAIRDAIL